MDMLTVTVTSLRLTVQREADLLQTMPSVIDTKLREHAELQQDIFEELMDTRITELATDLTGQMQSDQQQAAAVAAATPATFADYTPSRSYLAAAKPASCKPAHSLLAPSGSTATLEANTKAACFALRTKLGAHYVLGKYGMEALLANIDHMSEEDCNDNAVIEAVAQATHPGNESTRMPADTFGQSNLDASAKTFQQIANNKGRFKQTAPPQQSTRPAETTGHNKGSSFISNHSKGRQQLTGPTCAEQIPAFMNYMKSFNGKHASIPPQLAKPTTARRPNSCWVKACFGVNPVHNNWQSYPRAAEYFRTSNDMDIGI